MYRTENNKSSSPPKVTGRFLPDFTQFISMIIPTMHIHVILKQNYHSGISAQKRAMAGNSAPTNLGNVENGNSYTGSNLVLVYRPWHDNCKGGIYVCRLTAKTRVRNPQCYLLQLGCFHWRWGLTMMTVQPREPDEAAFTVFVVGNIGLS